MSYKLYMGSAYWIKRKNDYFSLYGKKCAVCGEKETVTLHHKRYDVHFGREPDDALVALCERHHCLFHKTHELKRGMTKTTNLYVKTMKQVEESGINDLSWI